MQVTEYAAPRKICPNCGKNVRREFPASVAATAQYGPAMQAAMTYLNVRQIIPCQRVADILPNYRGTLVHDFWCP